MKSTITRRGLVAVAVAAALALMALSPLSAAPKAKYVFLFIGDGMAMAQVTSTEIYSNAVVSKDIAYKRLGFTQFPAVGLTSTYDAGSFITDSASAGTAIATGKKTLNGVVNMDPGKTQKFTTLAEPAKAKGMKIGIVTTVSIDHATPATFYAKVPARGSYYDIAVQLGQSGFDYFGGGGLLQPKGAKGDQPDAFDLAKKAGYSVVTTNDAFRALKKGAGKVWAVSEYLQDSSSMYYDIDADKSDPSLAEFTKKGIELLSDDPDGFFMMVEGGKIDWAAHANDAGAVIHDVLALDSAVAEAVAFAQKYPNDTLIIVTGDHETGGMAIGFSNGYATAFDRLGAQTFSYQRFNDQVFVPYKKSTMAGQAKLSDMLPALESCFGLVYDKLGAAQKAELQLAFANSMLDPKEMVAPAQQDLAVLYGGYEPFTVKVTQILDQMAGIGWTTNSHSGVPVATFAKGGGQELFSGFYDNTEIFKKLCSVMDIAAK